jgi:hypothetical protein
VRLGPHLQAGSAWRHRPSLSTIRSPAGERHFDLVGRGKYMPLRLGLSGPECLDASFGPPPPPRTVVSKLRAIRGPTCHSKRMSAASYVLPRVVEAVRVRQPSERIEDYLKRAESLPGRSRDGPTTLTLITLSATLRTRDMFLLNRWSALRSKLTATALIGRAFCFCQ